MKWRLDIKNTLDTTQGLFVRIQAIMMLQKKPVWWWQV